MIVLVNRPGRCKGDRQQTGAHRRSKNLRKNLPGSGVCGWRNESSRRAPIKKHGAVFRSPSHIPLIEVVFLRLRRRCAPCWRWIPYSAWFVVTNCCGYQPHWQRCRNEPGAFSVLWSQMPISRNTFSFFQKNIFITLKRREECCGGSERSNRSLDGSAEGCRRAYFAKNAGLHQTTGTSRLKSSASILRAHV